MWFWQWQIGEPCNKRQSMNEDTGWGRGVEKKGRRDHLRSNKPENVAWRPDRLVGDSFQACVTPAAVALWYANHNGVKILDYMTESCVVWTVQWSDDLEIHEVWPGQSGEKTDTTFMSTRLLERLHHNQRIYRRDLISEIGSLCNRWEGKSEGSLSTQQSIWIALFSETVKKKYI